jgi:hypothetical protein
MTVGSAVRGFGRGETGHSEPLESRADVLPELVPHTPVRSATVRNGLDWHEFFVRLGEGTLPEQAVTAG